MRIDLLFPVKGKLQSVVEGNAAIRHKHPCMNEYLTSFAAIPRFNARFCWIIATANDDL